jgi:hypothetical protein
MLLAPLRYLRIQHAFKVRWDWWFPALGSIGLTAALRFWPAIPSPFVAAGYIAGLQSIFAILGGFFVAALTLLSTAQAPALHQMLTGYPAPRFAGEGMPLTRQRFLCLLFGYLSFSVFGLYLMGFAGTLLAPGARELIGAEVRWWLASAFLLFYNFWLSHTAIATLVGLYYFTDRLQRTDASFNDTPHYPAE